MLLIIFAGCASDPELPAERVISEASTGRAVTELERLAIELGLENPPLVNVIREVEPEESGVVVARCMEEVGWTSEVEDGGVIAYEEVPPEQVISFNTAYYICRAKYPINEKYTRPFTREQVELAYDHIVEVWIPCLRSHGVVVDRPSFDSFAADPRTPWYDLSSYVAQVEDSISAGTVGSFDELTGKCPKYPAKDILYEE